MGAKNDLFILFSADTDNFSDFIFQQKTEKQKYKAVL